MSEPAAVRQWPLIGGPQDGATVTIGARHPKIIWTPIEPDPDGGLMWDLEPGNPDCPIAYEFHEGRGYVLSRLEKG